MLLKLKNTSTTTDTRSGINFGNIDGIGGSLAMQSAILKNAATGEYDMIWDLYGGAAGWQEGILYIDSNPGTVAIGTAGSQTTSTYTGRLSIHKVGSGANIVLGTGCNTNNAVISRFVTYNSNNGNSGNEGATQFYGITSIESALTTSNSNASGNSGGYLMFKTKGDAGTLDERMRITSTGVSCFAGTVCAPCFATISDYRMKSNLRPIEGLSIIMNTKPYKFEYNYDCSTSFGMIAHELQDILPEAVFGQKDGEVMQGVDYMKLLPITIKAIQEQQCTIYSQATMINTLKTCLGII